MKKCFLLLLCFLFFQMRNVTFCQTSASISDSIRQKADTTSKVEDKVIDEVIESDKPIKKNRAQYLSEVTQYGFKDLFKNYSYNSTIPYSSQVNPHAEKYMQDYLNSHETYLQKLKKTTKIKNIHIWICYDLYIIISTGSNKIPNSSET